MHCQKYVCMYVRILCMYVCMYVRTYVCMYVCMYVCICASPTRYMHTCTYRLCISDYDDDNYMYRVCGRSLSVYRRGEGGYTCGIVGV